MFRTFLLIVAIALAALGLVALAAGLVMRAERVVVTSVFLLGYSAWLVQRWYRSKQQQALQAELTDRKLADGTRLGDVIGREWAAERDRLADMAELASEDVPDITWIPGEGPRRVRQQAFLSEDRVIRVYVAEGKIKKVRVEVRAW
ncbi:MAG: hypothetical protein NTV51_31355 [Verrucomicrobia bacterium]|nr:hypothetical protein [Verrucomicrobiota bacterium]